MAEERSPHATRAQTGTHVKWAQHERRLFSQESAVMNLWRVWGGGGSEGTVGDRNGREGREESGGVVGAGFIQV